MHFGFAHTMTYAAALQHGVSSGTEYSSVLQHILLSVRIFNIHLELAEQVRHRQEQQQRGCSALADCSIGKAPKRWYLACHSCKYLGYSTSRSLLMLWVWLLGSELWFHSHSSCRSRAWRRNGKNRSGLLVLPQKPATPHNNKHSSCVSGEHEVGYRVQIIYSASLEY